MEHAGPPELPRTLQVVLHRSLIQAVLKVHPAQPGVGVQSQAREAREVEDVEGAVEVCCDIEGE